MMNKSDVPDSPRSFGYKMAWFAIRTHDAMQVIRVFGFKDEVEANWETGINAVYGDDQGLSYVFITPPVDGWTLVVGLGLPSFDSDERRTEGFMALLDKLAKVFPDVCYFATHRVVEFHSWVRVAGGQIQRIYAYLGESGETLYDRGAKTEEEKTLGFNFFDERSAEAKSEGYYDREDLRYPNEEDVMRISAAWTINTQGLDERIEKGTGYIVRIKSG